MAQADTVTTADVVPSTYQAILDRHNYYRSWHQVPGLVWSNSLATAAANYAGQCVWGHDPYNSNQGENLYGYSATNNPAQVLMDAINGW